jgi:hypothetical protein
MKNRKELPPFIELSTRIDIDSVLKHCVVHGLLDYDKFNDIKKSSESHYKNFLVGNSYSKDSFFIHETEESLEGELYKQLYITAFKGTQDRELEIQKSSVKSRLRRIQPGNEKYVPELDEHNYGAPTEYYSGAIKEILDKFKSPVTRARLAVLMPGMTIKKHRDYDPSYICRYHIPIITNNSVIFGMEVDDQPTLFSMTPGNIYFFNSGLPHWVSNNGLSPRLHLIVDTNGQLDLET